MKLHDLNLSDLKYFLDAVEHQSLARSAEINHISSPAISKAIGRLGHWLGSPLLTHEKNVFQLTKAGENFYRDAFAAFKQMDRLLMASEGSGGEIRIGCSSSLAEPLLAPALKKLKDFNGAEIRIGTSSQIRRYLEDGEINLGLVVDDLQHPYLQQKVIHKGQFCFASANGRPTDLLITTEDRPEVFAARKFLRRKNISPARKVQVESWTVARQLGRSLGGMCVIPDFLLGKSMKPIFEEAFKVPYQISIIHNGRQRLSHSESRLAEALEQA